MTAGRPGLAAVIAAEALQAMAQPIAVVAEAARARFGASALAVLFYGSCLRDADDEGRIADLYVLVDDYGRAWTGRLAAFANRLLPPNVIYLEAGYAGRVVRAKVAVMTLEQFERGTTLWFQSYLWARFAQPSRLAWWRDEAVRERVLTALAGAVRRMAGEAAALLGPPFEARRLWTGALRATYSAELRAERLDRADELYDRFEARYRHLTECLAGEGLSAERGSGAAWRWALRRGLGKTLSVLRLVKAAFTFEDGASYLAWKIERHSGVAVPLTAWQRRHPVLASPLLFWRLYRKGAVL